MKLIGVKIPCWQTMNTIHMLHLVKVSAEIFVTVQTISRTGLCMLNSHMTCHFIQTFGFLTTVMKFERVAGGVDFMNCFSMSSWTSFAGKMFLTNVTHYGIHFVEFFLQRVLVFNCEEESRFKGSENRF